jgi:hypothetical protein
LRKRNKKEDVIELVQAPFNSRDIIGSARLVNKSVLGQNKDIEKEAGLMFTASGCFAVANLTGSPYHGFVIGSYDGDQLPSSSHSTPSPVVKLPFDPEGSESIENSRSAELPTIENIKAVWLRFAMVDNSIKLGWAAYADQIEDAIPEGLTEDSRNQWGSLVYMSAFVLYVQNRYNGLGNWRDWFKLYHELTSMLFGKNKPSFLPTRAVNLTAATRTLFRSLCPLTIGFIDGLGRSAAVASVILNLLPADGVGEHRDFERTYGKSISLPKVGGDTAKIHLMTLHAPLIDKAKMEEVHRLSTLLQAEQNLAKTFSIKEFLYRKVEDLATDDALIPYLVHNKISKGEGESRKDTIECSWDDWLRSRKIAVARLLDNSAKIPGDIHDMVNQYSVSANRRKVAKKHMDKGFCEAHLLPKYSGSKLYCQSGKYEVPAGLHWLVAVLSQHFYKMNRTDDSACRKMKAFMAKDFGVQDTSIMDRAPEWVYAEIDTTNGKAIFTKDLFRLTKNDLMEWTKENDVASTRESTQSEGIGNPILEFAKEIGHKKTITITLRQKYTRRHWDKYMTWYQIRSSGTGGRNSNRKVRYHIRKNVVGGSDRDTDFAASQQKFGNRWAAFRFPNFLFFAGYIVSWKENSEIDMQPFDFRSCCFFLLFGAILLHDILTTSFQTFL